MIPTTVITGYLGSGKTTILSKLLRHPGFGDTAVIINEFGEVGLDHDLIESSDEDLVTLKTGCLCCRMRGDLVETLAQLRRKREAGAVPPFARVVIETSGLADPAPILHSMMVDQETARHFAHPMVVTVVDAVNAAKTLAREPEAVRQVALADRLVVSKSDLAGADQVALNEHIRALNHRAPVTGAIFGDIEPVDLLGEADNNRDAREALVADLLNTQRPPHSTSEISTFTLTRDKPLAAVALSLFLEALAEHCGDGLLRMKGIVAIAETPDRPAVIHGVQHVYHAPAWLDAWPSDDRSTRIVFIGREHDRDWTDQLLELIEMEVEETAGGK